MGYLLLPYTVGKKNCNFSHVHVYPGAGSFLDSTSVHWLGMTNPDSPLGMTIIKENVHHNCHCLHFLENFFLLLCVSIGGTTTKGEEKRGEVNENSLS